jgi:hypothetical protein
MDLAERNERSRRVSGCGFCEQLAVADYIGTVVFRCKPQVELAFRSFRAVNMGDAAATSTETMPKPLNLVPARYREPFDPIESDSGNRRGWREFLRRYSLGMRLANRGWGIFAPLSNDSHPLGPSVDLSNVII